MTKKPTASAMEKALTKIANMDLGLTKNEMLELSHADALDMIVTLAAETLNPKAAPSAMELKVQEVTTFIMGDFKMAFATNDEIGDALNAAGILSPNGKPWTRSNVSKVMSSVKEVIVANVCAKTMTDEVKEEAEPEVADEPTPIPVTEDPIVAETTSGEASVEDELMAELDALDDLEGLAA